MALASSPGVPANIALVVIAPRTFEHIVALVSILCIGLAGSTSRDLHVNWLGSTSGSNWCDWRDGSLTLDSQSVGNLIMLILALAGCRDTARSFMPTSLETHLSVIWHIGEGSAVAHLTLSFLANF